MNKIEPRTLQGFMELMPNEQIAFDKIKNVIMEVYQKYGFTPIDTPVIEYSEVLLAKAGGETEKQIYRFNKGDNDLSLRFDLTVPLAKYVARRYNELVFPFKRYQIGKVFRGERPQKGRYREFYQCDIDVIGDETLSLSYDAEIPMIIFEIFNKLNFGRFVIRINNRKVLNGLFEYLQIDNKADCLRIIDKLDKMGLDYVKEDLMVIVGDESKVNYLLDIMSIKGSSQEKINKLRSLNIDNDNFKIGLDELEYVTNYLSKVIDLTAFKFDLTIARGLDYYTGTVYETNLLDYPNLGSICSGGRYDNLAEFYTDKRLPGVGISIGLTRLYSQLVDVGIINTESKSVIDALIIPMSTNLDYSLQIAKALRSNDIKVDICYLDKGMKQKFKYADRIKVKYAIILGEDEEKNNVISLKDMLTGEQKTLTIVECIDILGK